MAGLVFFLVFWVLAFFYVFLQQQQQQQFFYVKPKYQNGAIFVNIEDLRPCWSQRGRLNAGNEENTHAYKGNKN